MHHCPGKIGEHAQMLGITGLLPQIAAAAVTAMGHGTDLGAMFAFGYASLLLSFIGGAWWGFAMYRSEGQGRLAAVAVLPPIAAAAVILSCIAQVVSIGWGLALIGIAVLLTLLVDRRLVERGDAPPGWMHLRTPLSIGLGMVTIVTGMLA